MPRPAQRQILTKRLARARSFHLFEHLHRHRTEAETVGSRCSSLRKVLTDFWDTSSDYSMYRHMALIEPLCRFTISRLRSSIEDEWNSSRKEAQIEDTR